jgi:hypothetical protein
MGDAGVAVASFADVVFAGAYARGPNRHPPSCRDGGLHLMPFTDTTPWRHAGPLAMTCMSSSRRF